MRILHTSDWHLGKTLEKIDRSDEQKEFIEEINEIANENEVDVVLITGDIFDTYIPPSHAELLFHEAIEELSNNGKRAIIIIAGNHDSPDRLCAISPLVRKNGIFILGYPGDEIESKDSEYIKVIKTGAGWFELSLSTCSENIVISALPYPSEQRLDEVLTKEFSEEEIQKAYSDKIKDILNEAGENFRDDTVNIVASHIFVMGGKESGTERPIQVGGALTVNLNAFPKHVHYVALGHLHRPQKLKSEGTEIRYSGAPLAYSFSEENNIKSVNIITINEPDYNVLVKETYLKSGRSLKCWKAKNGIEEVFKWCQEEKDKEAWIDLEIYTDRVITLEEQKKLKSMNHRIVNIRPVIIKDYEDMKKYEGRETKKIDDLFTEFYKYKTGTEVDIEILNMFLDIVNE